MKLLLLAWGSRGDVQPFIALGRGLADAGYEVAIAAGEDFEGSVTAAGLGFRPFKVNMTEQMQEPLAVEWMSGSTSVRDEMRLMKSAFEEFKPIMVNGLIEMVEEADAFICGALTFDGLAPLAERAGKPVIICTLQPSVPTASGSAMMFPVLAKRRSILNYGWSFVHAAGTYTLIKAVSQEVRRRCGLPAGGVRDYLRFVSELPTLIGISPIVLPPSPDWPKQVSVPGYWIEQVPEGYAPPQALADFLAAGAPPIYVGFGSMPSMDPAGLRELALAAIARSGQRAIIGGSMHNGPAAAEQVNDHVLSVGSIPHEWLFAQTGGVITHGGAGTTGAALRAGVPVGVVAHIADQPFWGRRVCELGVGAPALTRPTLTVDRLAEQVRTVANSDELRRRAADLGAQLRSEDGVAVATETITRHLATSERDVANPNRSSTQAS